MIDFEDPVLVAQRIHQPLMHLIANRIQDHDELNLVARMIDVLVAGVSLKYARDGLRGTFKFSEYCQVRLALRDKLNAIPVDFGGLKR